MEYLVAVPLGFALGFLIGLTGVGGGALVAPALYVVLGLPYGEAVGLSLIYSLFTKIISAVQHFRQESVVWNVTLLYGLAGMPGAVIGSHLIYRAGTQHHRTFSLLMGGVLIFVAALILMEATMRRVSAWEKPFSPHELTWQVVLVVLPLQLVVGTLLGLTSVGSGSLVVLSMLYLFRMSAREIVGSNIVIALIMVIPAGLTHYAMGALDWRLLGLLLVGSAVGAVLGSKATLIAPERELKLAIAALIVAGAIATIVKAS